MEIIISVRRDLLGRIQNLRHSQRLRILDETAEQVAEQLGTNYHISGIHDPVLVGRPTGTTNRRLTTEVIAAAVEAAAMASDPVPEMPWPEHGFPHSSHMETWGRHRHELTLVL